MIIFISGPINSGKTTVSRILERKIKNLAVVEVDDLKKMIEWMPLVNAMSIDLKNMISLVKSFTENGLNTVVTYPIRKRDYKYIMKNLEGLKQKIYFFTLSPKIETALKNRGERKLTYWDVRKIKHHYKLGIASPSYGEIIDNTDQTPEETAEIILSKII